MFMSILNIALTQSGLFLITCNEFQVHLEYLEAGADVIVTSSYQVFSIAFTQIYAKIQTNDWILSNYFDQTGDVTRIPVEGIVNGRSRVTS